jgi:hypothetical protein
MGYQLLAATSDLLYRKSLRISKQSFATVTTGHVINLVSNDVERFIQGSIMIHFLYIGPIQVSPDVDVVVGKGRRRLGRRRSAVKNVGTKGASIVLGKGLRAESEIIRWEKKQGGAGGGAGVAQRYIQESETREINGGGPSQSDGSDGQANVEP